jgi:dolichol-phosphate mannosyltransferase
MITIIIPCYNEEQTIPLLQKVMLDVLSSLEQSHGVESLLVDDGSTDGTLAALEGMAPSVRGRLLVHDRNRGIAEAFRTGFHAANGDIICTIDADCTFDPLELLPMVDLLESTGADIVTASPYHPKGAVEGVPAWRLLLSRGASRLYRFLLPIKLYSYTACFRVFRRDAVERLRFRDPGFLGVSEMLASAILQGLKVVEWPTSLRLRRTGASKMRTFSVIGDHLRFMTRLALLRVQSAFRGGAVRDRRNRSG